MDSENIFNECHVSRENGPLADVERAVAMLYSSSWLPQRLCTLT